MDDEIKVTVAKYGQRANLMMRYVDPITNKRVSRSTGTSNRTEAERKAGVWEEELRQGKYQVPSKVTWQQFREKYVAEVLPGLAPATRTKVESVFDLVEQIINPGRLRAITPARLSFFASELRRERTVGEDVRQALSETTIKAYLAHLKAALRWAARTNLLHAAPAFPKITRAKEAKGSSPMKGRPITAEEFERMQAKVSSVVGEAWADEWSKLLTGLWLSGLRLGEAIALSWDAGTIAVDLEDEGEPVLVIPPESQKNHKLQLVPMAPEFADMLLATPAEQRTGFVFNPAALDDSGRRASQSRAGRTIADIGRAANVKVYVEPRTGRVKFASAHDLRRAFGERWAARVTTPILQQMMRHETVTTTLRFYAGRNAKAAARAARAALNQVKSTQPSNTFGNTAHSGDPANSRK